VLSPPSSTSSGPVPSCPHLRISHPYPCKFVVLKNSLEWLYRKRHAAVPHITVVRPSIGLVSQRHRSVSIDFRYAIDCNASAVPLGGGEMTEGHPPLDKSSPVGRFPLPDVNTAGWIWFSGSRSVLYRPFYSITNDQWYQYVSTTIHWVRFRISIIGMVKVG